LIAHSTLLMVHCSGPMVSAGVWVCHPASDRHEGED
jgi:hypothetical protein